MNKREYLSEIIKRLKKEYPKPKTALLFNNPFELLVATILSAQTTDVHINKITEKLFKKYKSIKDYVDVPLEEFKHDIKSVNFFNNKAKNIQATAKMIIGKFNGVVPKTMEELVGLAGVARKTANIILSNAYGINAGIAVDTHVKRLSGRLGLSKYQDPVKIEKELLDVVDQKDWAILSHLLIQHGRTVCKAKTPLHNKCVLFDLCPSKISL